MSEARMRLDQEVARILMKGVADGSLNGDDRAYLARMVCGPRRP